VEALLYADAKGRCHPDCWGVMGEMAPPKTTQANLKPPGFLSPLPLAKCTSRLSNWIENGLRRGAAQAEAAA